MAPYGQAQGLIVKEVLLWPLRLLFPRLACLLCGFLALCGATLSSPRTRENPAYHSCWLNESDNRIICRIAASCHRRVFEQRVLKSWELLQAGAFYF